jgi:hypothetical protein
VARRHAAHAHRLERAEPAERSRERADGLAERVGDRRRRRMLVGVNDRDERRVAEQPCAIARGRRVRRRGRAIDDDDRLVGARARRNENDDWCEDE